MSQTPQDTQPTTDLKHYHAPEFRDYGTVQDLTHSSETISNGTDSLDGVNTNSVSISAPAQDGSAIYMTGGVG
jgi:hypothetical protein